MTERTKIDPASLPPLRDLHRATAAIAVCVVLLAIFVVLPAERGIDPTGVGEALGLTALGELKQGAEVAEGVAAAPTFRTDELSVTIAPGKGTEVKAVMRAGDQLMYSWDAAGGSIFFDFHGEPAGAASGVFTSFEKGTKGAAEGEFEAPFDGVHGWYWQNMGTEPATVTVTTHGVYANLAQVH